MKVYSDFSGRRAWQIFGDLAAVAVLVTGILVAVAIHNAIAGLAAVGADVRQAGSDFQSNMAEIGGDLAGVPLIGGGIAAPFAAASNAGQTLADAGSSWQRGVESLAAATGWTIALLVVAAVALGWIVPRTFGAVRRTRLAHLASSPASWDLLALRALTDQPIQHVAAIDDDVAAAWRRREPLVIRRLAALQLRASGVRLGGS